MPLVVGVGRRDRRDDAAGLLVVAEVSGRDRRCDVGSVETPVQLLDAWSGRDVVVVVDATRSHKSPGDVTVADASDHELPARMGGGGSHALDVAAVVELGRALERLPRRLVVVGIEAADTTAGLGLTPPVAAALDTAVGEVVGLLDQFATEGVG